MAGTILFSRIDEAERFPDFVSELRGFFSAYGLPVGSPDAVLQMADSIAGEETFRDDLLSMLQVVCAHEEKISYLELLGLLLVSAAGREGADELRFSPAAEEPLQRLFQFVVQARRPADDPVETASTAETADSGLIEPHDFTTDEVGDGPLLVPVALQAMPEAAGREPRASMLARALAISADEDPFVPTPPKARDLPALPRSVPGAVTNDEIAVPTFVARDAVASTSRNIPAWAVGAFGVALGLLLGFLIFRESAVRAPLPAAPATASRAAAQNTTGRVAEGVSRGAGSEPSGSEGVAAARDSNVAPQPEVSGRLPHMAGTKAGRDTGTRSTDEVQPRSTRSNGNSGSPGAPATRASASAPGLAVPRVRPVDMNAEDEAGTMGSSGGLHTKLPSIVTGSSGIMAANLISAPAPAYPAQASDARVQGEVVIEAVVGRDGTVKDTRVVSGPELLRQAALNAVQHWQFRPYEVDGTPAEIATTARLQFRLNTE